MSPPSRASERATLLSDQWVVIHNALRRYFRATKITDPENPDGAKLEKAVSNRGIGALALRNGRVKAHLAAIDAHIVQRKGGRRSFENHLDEVEREIASAISACRRHAVRGVLWIRARQNAVNRSLSYLRGWRVDDALTSDAVDDARALVAKHPESRDVVVRLLKLLGRTRDATEIEAETPVDVPSFSQCAAIVPSTDASVVERLTCCVVSAAHELGVPRKSLDIRGAHNSQRTIVVHHHGERRMFVAGRGNGAWRATCEAIHQYVSELAATPRGQGKMTKRSPFPSSLNVRAVLAQMGRAAELTELHDIVSWCVSRYSLNLDDTTRLRREHEAAVRAAVEAGRAAIEENLHQYKIKPPREASPPPRGATTEQVASATAADEELLRKVRELPMDEAARIVAEQNEIAASTGTAHGLESVVKGERIIGVSHSHSVVAKVDDARRAGARLALWHYTVAPGRVGTVRLEKSLAAASQPYVNCYFYAAADHEATAKKIAERYMAVQYDELHGARVADERYVAQSRDLGYSDEEIHQWFVAEWARAVLKERRAAEKLAAAQKPADKPADKPAAKATEKPAEPTDKVLWSTAKGSIQGFPVRSMRVVETPAHGKRVQVVMVNRPPTKLAAELTAAGFSLDRDAKPPHWSGDADAPGVIAVALGVDMRAPLKPPVEKPAAKATEKPVEKPVDSRAIAHPSPMRELAEALHAWQDDGGVVAAAFYADGQGFLTLQDAPVAVKSALKVAGFTFNRPGSTKNRAGSVYDAPQGSKIAETLVRSFLRASAPPPPPVEPPAPPPVEPVIVPPTPVAPLPEPETPADIPRGILERVEREYQALSLPRASAVNLARVIATGRWSSILDPDNKNSRAIFAKLTGHKLPRATKQAQELFTGEPFALLPEGMEKPPQSFPALYRSVSPVEMRAIREAGCVIGNGNAFSSDDRDLAFFGASLAEVIHNGEDANRAMYARGDRFAEAREAERLADEAAAAHRKAEDSGAKRAVVERLWKASREASDRASALHKEARRALERDAADATARWRAEGATSFVIELPWIDGGVIFLPRGQHGYGRSLGTGPEVGYPRNCTIKADMIQRVHVVLDGVVTRTVSWAEFNAPAPVEVTPAAPAPDAALSDDELVQMFGEALGESPAPKSAFDAQQQEIVNTPQNAADAALAARAASLLEDLASLREDAPPEALAVIEAAERNLTRGKIALAVSEAKRGRVGPDDSTDRLLNVLSDGIRDAIKLGAMSSRVALGFVADTERQTFSTTKTFEYDGMGTVELSPYFVAPGARPDATRRLVSVILKHVEWQRARYDGGTLDSQMEVVTTAVAREFLSERPQVHFARRLSTALDALLAVDPNANPEFVQRARASVASAPSLSAAAAFDATKGLLAKALYKTSQASMRVRLAANRDVTAPETAPAPVIETATAPEATPEVMSDDDLVAMFERMLTQ